MKAFVHGMAVLLVAASAVLGTAAAQDKATLDTARDKESYMVGLDVGRSIGPAGPDMDLAAFERAVANALAGGKPLIPENQVQPLAQALMTRIAGLHSYDVPCVVVWPIDKLLGSYAEWVEASVG